MDNIKSIPFGWWPVRGRGGERGTDRGDGDYYNPMAITLSSRRTRDLLGLLGINSYLG